MKKKLSLEKLSVKSFVTDSKVEGGVPYITYGCPNQTLYRTCTMQVQVCPWYSELYTACNCPESELQPCLTSPACAEV
jgi:hypothetical protein